MPIWSCSTLPSGRSASILPPQHQSSHQACDVLFENEEGEIDNIFEDQMPFDTDADVIEIDDADYGIWYVDMGDNPERYEARLFISAVWY